VHSALILQFFFIFRTTSFLFLLHHKSSKMLKSCQNIQIYNTHVALD